MFAGIEGITSKKMMGEYILYTDGCIFGGLYDNRLLIKKNDLSDELFADCSLVYPYDGSKTLMYSVDVDEKNRIKEFMEKFKSK